MKFTIDQKTLSQALSHVIKAVPNKPTHPVLGCIKLETVGASLTLTGFDLSTAIVRTIEASVEHEGYACLPGHLLTDIVSKLPNENVLLDLVCENMVKIQSLTGEFTIQGMDAEEFPDLPNCKNDPFFVETDVLVSGLKSVLYSASTDATKQVLTGVNIGIDGDDIKLAATDGHRLTTAENQVTKETAEEEQTETEPTKTKLNVTIPATALGDLVTLLEGTATPSIEVVIDEGQARFKAEGRSLLTRVLDGAYPNYPTLIPQSFSGFAIVNRKALFDSLNRVTVLDSKTNLVVLKFKSNELTIHRESETGSAHESIKTELTGEVIEIGFNSKYLIEAVKNLSSNDIKISFNQPNSPVVLNPVNGDKVMALIMPVQSIR